MRITTVRQTMDRYGGQVENVRIALLVAGRGTIDTPPICERVIAIGIKTTYLVKVWGSGVHERTKFWQTAKTWEEVVHG